MRALLTVLVTLAAAAAEGAVVPWCFSDESFPISDLPVGDLTAELERLPARGEAQRVMLSLAVDANGSVAIEPLGPGIHVLRVGALERRFLAVAPPPVCDPAALRRALPRSADRLLAGQPITLLAMGDSVTATGDYHHLLAGMLARATGNRHLSVRVAAHPGCSVDATLRNFERETADGVDIGLLMYGLNDQGAGVPIAAFREQCGAVAVKLAAKDADCVLLQPTPHIAVPEEAPLDPVADAWAYVLRTRGFAAELSALGLELGLPVASTFDALWGAGAADLPGVYRALRGCFPPHYSKTLERMDEQGDTIHPNANGHALLAAAIYHRLAIGPEAGSALHAQGVTRWTQTGPVTDLTVTNDGPSQRTGVLHVFGPLQVELGGMRHQAYDLDPGGSLVLSLTWPAVTTAEDMRRHPYDRHLAPVGCWLTVLDQQAIESVVLVARAERAPPIHLAAERQTVPAEGAAQARWLRDGVVYRNDVIPAPDALVARTPLQVEGDGSVAVGEMAWVRYAAAVAGETVIDGHLDEWAEAVWSPLGLPVQARWTAGPLDRRVDPQDCFVHWSVRAGSGALVLGARISGAVERDRFTLWFDPRPPADLGSPGGYYWLDGRFSEDGSLKLNRGSTSSAGTPSAAWSEEGDVRTVEVAIPYAVLDLDGWPESGDLGWSFLWRHEGPDGPTMLQWSEDRHPWNPRWFGVVRLQSQPDPQSLPWMVRTR